MGELYSIYPKIAREVLSIWAIFIDCCGCDVKKSGPAMPVYLKIEFRVPGSEFRV